MKNLIETLEVPLEYTATTRRSFEGIASQILIVAFLFWALERLLSFGAPRAWIQQKFKSAGKAACRIVGMVHLIIQIPLALLILFDSTFKSDPIYATTDLSFVVTIISAGYFCYDLYICVFRWEGPAYLLHGATCSTLYSYCALSGFIHYFAALFLLWELSTPFVYIRWFLYNLNMAGSRLYVGNGLAMLLSFFWARNVMGAFMLVNFFRTTEKELQSPKSGGSVMGPPMIWTYRVACVALTCLNAMWFVKMFKGALKVFTSKAPAKETAERVERSQTGS